MKRLAGLQVILGILAALDCWNLSIVRKYSPPWAPGSIVIPTTSPSYYGDAALVFIGLAVFVVALLLRAQKATLSTLQIILSQDIAIISFILYRMALDNDEYIRSFSWLVFVVMAAAILLSVTGVIQILMVQMRKQSPTPGNQVGHRQV